MTILVPTDFSKPSKVAVLYAVRLAKKLKADIILLAVINVNIATDAILDWKKREEQMGDVARHDAEQLIAEIKKEINGGVKIEYRSIMGFPFEDMVENVVVDDGLDLIIMGTKGATGLKKVLLGSNAASVIDNSSVPVLSVPANTIFKPVKKIVYATDMLSITEEIKPMAMFARIFNAAIRVLHVLPGDSPKIIDELALASDLIKITNYPKISFHVLRNNSIAEEVDSFVMEQKADMLAMFTHKLDFYEKLFGKSVTRQLAFHAHVPLLTFNKTTLL
ncbi:MAG: universal stress protein [Cyclobacteriaceae bacterium]|nr:universal stress protein [Cyclobacteriaceae bacterium]